MVEGKDLARAKAEARQRKLVDIRRTRRKQILIIASVIIAVVMGVAQLFRSGVFNVKSVDISGNKYVSPVRIVETCGINENTNLLSVPTGKLQVKIEKDPWVKSVVVRRALPNTLKIVVDERVPKALISHTGKFFLVDEELFIIAERQYAEGINVPIITDLPVSKMKVGRRLLNGSLENAMNCLKEMSPAFQKSINLISASSIDKLTLYNKDNVEILFGSAENARDKNKILDTIISKQGKQVIQIDIRNYPKSDPVVKRIDSMP
ncbi:MAG: hypothetical protein A2074_06710 [Candidatus Aquicultor primus]|uniref:POTRA domain-containing protein n=1 Tax=Candidatus Aquicultor primus TaxID=1797195 RepID=A0A1F2UPF4_9ACTN|nr:MAG: hypothetical protein A2074_06710 [Candidatus Aquicultor primus]HCH00118.1 hypothetical protein [Actinomycetota bacterium]